MTQPLKLTWSDLLIQPTDAVETQRWLQEWHGAITGRLAPIALSRFGSWFFLREDGRVKMLDVLEGHISTIAGSHDEFVQLVNTPSWQEENLLSLLVYQLHEAGKRASAQQCYLIAPHPRLGGPNPWVPDAVDPKFVLVVDPIVCQTICAQSIAAAGGLQHS